MGKMGSGFLRISLFTLVSAFFFVACGKDESNGDDDDGDTTNTTGTPTTTTSGNPTSSTSNSTTNNSTTATGSGGSSSTTAAQGGSGGAGGTTSVGGSAGGGGDMGGSAGSGEGGDGGTANGGTVVVKDDCAYEACGGDLANTDWTYSGICVEKEALLAPFQGFCDTLELVSAGGEVTGTISFTDDTDGQDVSFGTFTQDVSFSVTGEFAVPQSCVPGSCAIVTLGLAASGLADANCRMSDTGCTCSGTLVGESALDGDYTTDDETLTLDGEGASYCASGDSFKYTGEIEGVEFVYETVPQ